MTIDQVHTRRPLGVAVVGAGYWGANLVRNLATHPDTDLHVICDLDEARAKELSRLAPGARVTTSLDDVLDDERVDAVAVATPAATHHAVAGACLDAGRHVLIEKPIATNAVHAQRLASLAAVNARVLMCDHTYCYTPAAIRIRELVHGGHVGELLYVDSVRVNLGLVQPDVDVFWDLAPHDLSIIDFVLPPGCGVEAVAAQGADPLGTGRACVGHLTLRFTGGGIGHVHVNWLSPMKVRTTILGGSRRNVVWDDMNPAQRVSVYDKGVDLGCGGDEGRRASLVSYRVGDMVAPALREREALAGVVDELVASVREGRPARTDAAAGIRVVRILEAAAESRCRNGAFVAVDAAGIAA